MLARVFAVGLLAGLLAGLIVALLQAYTTTPLIIEAERFENAEAPPPAASLERFGGARLILVHNAGHAEDDAGHADAWAPVDGLERTFLTTTATIGTAAGFALILIAGMLSSGDRITEHTALAWGAAGFAAAGLAPAMGLAPELPGMMAADLLLRQQWWLATCMLTAIAIWLFLRASGLWRLAAIGLLLAPHLWGAPRIPSEAAGAVPADLAARFAAVSLAVQATLWLTTAYFVGLLWPRIGASEDSADGR